MSIIEKALIFFKERQYVVVATADKGRKPNCAPKLLLKLDGEIIYCIDYSIGRTFHNLKVNPEVSLSLMDTNSLFGYILNGKAEIIEEGKIYDECLKELHEKEMELTINRVVKGVQDSEAHKDFESENPERFLVYKVKIEEGFEINPRGIIECENSR